MLRERRKRISEGVEESVDLEGSENDAFDAGVLFEFGGAGGVFGIADKDDRRGGDGTCVAEGVGAAHEAVEEFTGEDGDGEGKNEELVALFQGEFEAVFGVRGGIDPAMSEAGEGLADDAQGAGIRVDDEDAGWRGSRGDRGGRWGDG